MAGLQRSAISFRRQGSSGLVWEDRFISGELNQNNKNKEEEQQQNQQQQQGGGEVVEFRELRTSRSVGSIGAARMMERSRSNGGGRERHHRTGKVSPALDPPSPKVSGCGFCGVFGKPVGTHRSKTGNKKRKS
ncbi:hypothetical protein BVC80_9089g53 [Macleaya cordata]|uniref:MAPK kinase substrate protein n=1 Tax=Macleaya cordata TaxID=56857 RepID=A0A200PQH8_MACCD|nr:hypothetical protein BVC80_9089g53 [Macleaya cordata]